jgi:hypothetical protein
LPQNVIQQEVTNKHELRRVRGTTKAAVLRGDPDSNDLPELSFYDSKPLYFMSTVHDEIKWKEVNKKVYCRETGKKEENKFLRLNINNDYNFKMHDVDRADQL